MTETKTTEDDIERGPNGFPYVDTSRSTLGQWSSGEFHFKLAREDGELLSVNLKRDQFETLKMLVEEIDERSD